MGESESRQRGTPPLSEGRVRVRGTSLQLTPRELLQRLLEWGEPLRSRDTCFRTSAATVLWGQEGGRCGQENLGSRALRPRASGPRNSFYKRKVQAVARKKTGCVVNRTQTSRSRSHTVGPARHQAQTRQTPPAGPGGRDPSLSSPPPPRQHSGLCFLIWGSAVYPEVPPTHPHPRLARGPYVTPAPEPQFTHLQLPSQGCCGELSRGLATRGLSTRVRSQGVGDEAEGA